MKSLLDIQQDMRELEDRVKEIVRICGMRIRI